MTDLEGRAGIVEQVSEPVDSLSFTAEDCAENALISRLRRRKVEKIVKRVKNGIDDYDMVTISPGISRLSTGDFVHARQRLNADPDNIDIAARVMVQRYFGIPFSTANIAVTELRGEPTLFYSHKMEPYKVHEFPPRPKINTRVKQACRSISNLLR